MESLLKPQVNPKIDEIYKQYGVQSVQVKFNLNSNILLKICLRILILTWSQNQIA